MLRMSADLPQRHVFPVRLPEYEIGHRIDEDPRGFARKRFVEVAPQERRLERLKAASQAREELRSPARALDLLLLLPGLLRSEASGILSGVAVRAAMPAAPDRIEYLIAPIYLCFTHSSDLLLHNSI